MSERFYEEQEEERKLRNKVRSMLKHCDVASLKVEHADVEYLTAVNIYLRGYECFAVVKGVDRDDRAWVAFDSGDTLIALLLKVLSKALRGGLRWKVDVKKAG